MTLFHLRVLSQAKYTRFAIIICIASLLTGCGFPCRYAEDLRAIPTGGWTNNINVGEITKIDCDAIYCSYDGEAIVGYLRFWRNGKMIMKLGNFTNPIKADVADTLSGSYVGVYNFDNDALVTEWFRPTAYGHVFQLIRFTMSDGIITPVDNYYIKRSMRLWWEIKETHALRSSVPLRFVKYRIPSMKTQPDWE